MNRCPKCDNDRFWMDEVKKGQWELHVEDAEITNTETGEVKKVKHVKCSWCNNLMPMAVI